MIIGTEAVIDGIKKKKIKITLKASDFSENSLNYIINEVRKGGSELLNFGGSREIGEAIERGVKLKSMTQNIRQRVYCVDSGRSMEQIGNITGKNTGVFGVVNAAMACRLLELLSEDCKEECNL